MSEHVTLSITIVVYKKYDDVLLAVHLIEHFTDTKLSKKIYIVDNSVYADDNHYKQTFLDTLSNYKDVEYIDTKKNLGFGKGHNYVLPQLNSNFHAIVNPDIVLYSDAFSPLISFLQQNPNVGMTAPILTDEYNNIQPVCRRDLTLLDLFCRSFHLKCFEKRMKYHVMAEVDMSKDFECPFIQGSFLVVRTEIFKKIKGFDERYFMYAEDADLCRTIRHQSKIIVHTDVKVVHKWEKASHTNFKLMKIHLISLLKYFCKWGWKLK